MPPADAVVNAAVPAGGNVREGVIMAFDLWIAGGTSI